MRHFFTLCPVLLLLLSACSPSRRSTSEPADPLAALLKTHAADFDSVLQRPEYEVQIIYTRIDRDARNRPSFRSWQYQVDSSRYFYPASTVKMPLALLALEKINRLRQNGHPDLYADTPYALDSLRPFQQAYAADAQSPGGLPSIAHDVRQIFVVSDNLAYNHLFEFLGREHINRRLAELGYSRTGIMHRFNYPGRDNRYTSPIRFFSAQAPTQSLYAEAEKLDQAIWPNPQHNTSKGKGYYNAADSLIGQPFDMGRKNWFSLSDMERMLRAVMFPESLPAPQRFDLTPQDYALLHHYMGIYPRECDYPRYDSSYFDGYVKFFLYGDGKDRRPHAVRSFNKVGEAYGTLTDVAYIVDFEQGVEFILAATILCNSDGIFNDDQYDYERTGFPFLAKLGRVVLDYERQRKRTYRPDLSTFQQSLK